MLKIVKVYNFENFNKEARKTRFYKRVFCVEQGGLMKSLDELFKELEKENKVQSLNLAQEFSSNYNSQINSILKGLTIKKTLPR